jgi:hypothetical protein
MDIVNTTPFLADKFVAQDPEGRESLVIIVKCTYTLNEDMTLSPAENQAPLQMADDYFGAPGESSIRYESDLVPLKLATDIVMVGHAHPPGGYAKQIDVMLSVGPYRKTCRVFSDREWKKALGMAIASDPAPFDKIPLVYERAFGGKDQSAPEDDKHEAESRNPIGCGFTAKKSRLRPEEVTLPNIEDPNELIERMRDRPPPAGFGFIGRQWQPRVAFAGTYDQAWMDTRSPLLPEDFDERYYNGAHPDLVTKEHLKGGEAVEIVNASPQGTLKFTLPTFKPRIALVSALLEREFLEPRFDTLILEPDEKRVVLVWRASKNIRDGMNPVKIIEVE